jgi:hypothetical protein
MLDDRMEPVHHSIHLSTPLARGSPDFSELGAEPRLYRLERGEEVVSDTVPKEVAPRIAWVFNPRHPKNVGVGYDLRP